MQNERVTEFTLPLWLRSRFLISIPIDIWGQIIFVVGVSLGIVERLPVSLPCSTQCQWHIIPLLATTKNVSRYFLIFL